MTEEEFERQQEQDQNDAEEKQKRAIEEARAYAKRKAREAKKQLERNNKLKMYEQYFASKLTVDWVSDDKSFWHDGILQEQVIFKIKKGLTLYTLYIKDKDVQKSWKKPWHTGTHLQELKEKAEVILKEHYKILKENDKKD